VQTELCEIDPESARFIYLLFKKDIQGEIPMDGEYKDLQTKMEQKNFFTSNLAIQLY
jgi:hypothetical protein